MNTYNRSQGMDNRLNMLFNQELDNEAQYIKSHPFSSINMSLGGEVRYIAPIWPWNAPRFQALDWRLQPPPSRVPGNTKHNQGEMFKLPMTWGESTNACWSDDQKPPPAFPFTRSIPKRDQLFSTGGQAPITAGPPRLRTSQSPGSNRSRAPTANSDRPPTNRTESRGSGKGRLAGEANAGTAMPSESLRLNLPASQLPGRPATNASGPARPVTGATVRANASRASNRSANRAASNVLVE